MQKKYPWSYRKYPLEKAIERFFVELTLKVRKWRIPKRKDDKMFLIAITIVYLLFGYGVIRAWLNI